MATISEPSGTGGISNRTPAAAANTLGSGWSPANPAPLGLCGFGITTLVLSVINANLVSSTGTPVVLGLAIAYGGTAQLLAGMWEFRTGNVFGAVAFTSYGAFWISYFFLVTFDAKLIPAAEAGSAIGLYLWAWAIFTGMMFFCSFAATRAVQVVFLLLTLTFIFLGIGASGASSGMTHLGGWIGIATAIAALYTAAGEIMATVYTRDVLPLGRPAPRI
jgi:succinate-acetate transporter protein